MALTYKPDSQESQKTILRLLKIWEKAKGRASRHIRLAIDAAFQELTDQAFQAGFEYAKQQPLDMQGEVVKRLEEVAALGPYRIDMAKLNATPSAETQSIPTADADAER